MIDIVFSFLREIIFYFQDIILSHFNSHKISVILVLKFTDTECIPNAKFHGKLSIIVLNEAR